MVKRVGDLFESLTSMENLTSAYLTARKTKPERKDVRDVDADPIRYLIDLRMQLQEGSFVSSKYCMFEIREGGKTREVADIRFFPDRIVHQAVTNVISSRIISTMIEQTHAAIPGRGVHSAICDVRRYLRDPKVKYALKTDVRKFFKSINKEILMVKLERRFKDPRLLDLMREIVFGYPHSGIPIGNTTSQYFANLYLSDIDHTMKEQYHCHYYVRYMDDIIILGYSKPWLHKVRDALASMLEDIGLTMKGNWQIFPIEDRGIDFVGYRIWPDHVLLRNTTKHKMKTAMKEIAARLDAGKLPTQHDLGCIASYHGILSWCDSYRLSQRTIVPVMARISRLRAMKLIK